jgi:nucleoside-diphosphate-sugar epimerase
VREVVEMIYREAGHTPKMRAAPPWLLSLLGLFDPNLRELKELLYQWSRPYEVDHGKFAARFGDDVMPLDDGVAAMVRWFREQDPEA